MAKNRFEYNMEGIRDSGRSIKQKRQGEAIGKKPTGDNGPRFNADPRMPKNKPPANEPKSGPFGDEGERWWLENNAPAKGMSSKYGKPGTPRSGPVKSRPNPKQRSAKRRGETTYNP